MQASDLIITKPGGLTVTEALASNLPLLVFNSIPGQEEDNADFWNCMEWQEDFTRMKVVQML